MNKIWQLIKYYLLVVM